MGIDIDAMEIRYRIEWNDRPKQWGGRYWYTVEEYYDLFCYWKDQMERMSCPADEENYVHAFIENLKVDLRVRLSKRLYQPTRLSDAVSNAKFEEAMMALEDYTANFSQSISVDINLEEIVSSESAIKHSIVAENEQVEEIVDNGAGVLPFTDLESVVSLEGEGIAIKHELKSFSIHESVEEGLEVGKLWASELEQQSPLTLEGPGAAHNLFDKNPSLPLKEHNEGSHRSDDCVRLFHCMPLVTDLGVVGTEACYVLEEMSHYSAGVVKAQRDRIILNSLCLFKKGDIIALSDVDDMDTGSEAMGVKDGMPIPDTCD